MSVVNLRLIRSLRRLFIISFLIASLFAVPSSAQSAAKYRRESQAASNSKPSDLAGVFGKISQLASSAAQYLQYTSSNTPVDSRQISSPVGESLNSLSEAASLGAEVATAVNPESNADVLAALSDAAQQLSLLDSSLRDSVQPGKVPEGSGTKNIERQYSRSGNTMGPVMSSHSPPSVRVDTSRSVVCLMSPNRAAQDEATMTSWLSGVTSNLANIMGTTSAPAARSMPTVGAVVFLVDTSTDQGQLAKESLMRDNDNFVDCADNVIMTQLTDIVSLDRVSTAKRRLQASSSSFPPPPTAGYVSSAVYHGAIKAQSLMKQYESFKQPADIPSPKAVPQFSSVTAETEHPPPANPLDLSMLTGKSQPQMPKNVEQLNVLNAFIGTGFAAALDLMGNSHENAATASQPLTLEQLQAEKAYYEKELTLVGVNEKSRKKMKEVPQWLFEMGNNDGNGLAVDSTWHDSAMAYVAGCDCKSFPGVACSMESSTVSVQCDSYKVWDESKRGAELVDVIGAIDEAARRGADVAVLPVWFGPFNDLQMARQAPRVLRGVMKRASNNGVLFAIPAGDSGTVGASTSEFVSQPCDQLTGVYSMCVSSVDPMSGSPNWFANVPLRETIYAVGESVMSLDQNMNPATYTGTSMALAQAVGVANLVQGIGKTTGKAFTAQEQLATILNTNRKLSAQSVQGGSQQLSGFSQEASGQYTKAIESEGGVPFKPSPPTPPTPPAAPIRGTALDAGNAVEKALYKAGVLPAGTCFLENTNFVGEAFLVVRAADENQCQLSCKDGPKCKFFAYGKQRHLCYHYDKVAGTIDAMDVIIGPQACSPQGSVQERAVMDQRIYDGTVAAKKMVSPGAAMPLENMHYGGAAGFVPRSPQHIPFTTQQQPPVYPPHMQSINSQQPPQLQQAYPGQVPPMNGQYITQLQQQSYLGNGQSMNAQYPLSQQHFSPYVQFAGGNQYYGGGVAPYGSPGNVLTSSVAKATEVVSVPVQQITSVVGGTATRVNSGFTEMFGPVGAGGLNNFLTTANAAAQTGQQFVETFPVEQMFKAGTQLYNSEFLRQRGMKTPAANAKGLEKQSVMPPPGVGKPVVTCLNQGMKSCVPRIAADDWQDNPPRLNDEVSSQCQAVYISSSDQLCVTTLYDGEQSCGMLVTETSEMMVYQNVMKMNGKSMNNAIFQCIKPKGSMHGEESYKGYASWEYSMQAVVAADASAVGNSEKDTSKAERNKKLAKGATTALGWYKMLGDQGPTAVNGLGEVIRQVTPDQGSYDMIAQVPGLTLGPPPRRRRLQSWNAAIKADSTVEKVYAPVESSTDASPCLTPWPWKCSAWRSECEDDGETFKDDPHCSAVDLVVDGCPQEEVDFQVNDVQPGLISLSMRPFMFAQGAPFRIGCEFSLVPCSEAKAEKKCPLYVSTSAPDWAVRTGQSRPARQLMSKNVRRKGEAVEARADPINEEHQHDSRFEWVTPRDSSAVNLTNNNELSADSTVAPMSFESTVRDKLEMELRLFNDTLKDRLRKYTRVTFNGGIGDLLLGQWIDPRSGEALDVAEVESVNSEYIDTLVHELKRRLASRTSSSYGHQPSTDPMEVDIVDIKDFKWLSKVEVIPRVTAETTLVLDKYQPAPGGKVVELQMSKSKFWFPEGSSKAYAVKSSSSSSARNRDSNTYTNNNGKAPLKSAGWWFQPFGSVLAMMMLGITICI